MRRRYLDSRYDVSRLIGILGVVVVMLVVDSSRTVLDLMS